MKSGTGILPVCLGSQTLKEASGVPFTGAITRGKKAVCKARMALRLMGNTVRRLPDFDFQISYAVMLTNGLPVRCSLLVFADLLTGD